MQVLGKFVGLWFVLFVGLIVAKGLIFPDERHFEGEKVVCSTSSGKDSTIFELLKYKKTGDTIESEGRKWIYVSTSSELTSKFRSRQYCFTIIPAENGE